MTVPEITADRLRALAKGPALDLPPVHWEAPVALSDRPAVRWGALPWENVETDWVANVYLRTYDYLGTGPLIDVGEQRLTLAEARIVLNRLASAVALAEEVSR